MPRTALVVALASLAGCGRLGFEGAPDTADAASTVDALACSERVFSTPAASSLVDTFSSPGFLERWAPIAPCVAPTDGQLLASPPVNGEGYCHVWTAIPYRLTCDRMTVQVASATASQAGVHTYVYVGDRTTGAYLWILVEAGLVTYAENAIGKASWSYDPVADRWWQLRELGGELVVETSPDGTTWVERVRRGTPVSLDTVHIALGAGTYRSLAAPGTAAFRCYNAAPPCT